MGHCIASFAYSSLVQGGYTIVSDNIKFIGGKALWKKIARTKLPNEVLYISHRNNFLLNDNGNPIDYNGINIEDSKIWGKDNYFGGKNDIDHNEVVLIYMKK